MSDGWKVSEFPPVLVGAGKVDLRRLRLEDQEFLDRLNAARNLSRFNQPDPGARPSRAEEKLARPGFFAEAGGHALIVPKATGEPIGDIAWKPLVLGRRMRSWTPGRELLPEARGHGYGTEAMAMLVDWLFRETNCLRVEGVTSAQNARSQGSITKLGFVHEGTLREAFDDGERGLVDGWYYGMIRSDWEKHREQWPGL